MSAEPAFPRALDDDDDDVAWALQTAQARWERGGHDDAVVWLRRAAQSALELGEFGRAADLEKSARQIDVWLKLNQSDSLAQNEEDDGVDALLDADVPELETHALEGPTPSLVDAIEAEERGESPLGPEPVELDVDEVEELADEEIIEEPPPDDDEPGPALPSFPLDSETTVLPEEPIELVARRSSRAPAPPYGEQAPAPRSSRAPSSVITRSPAPPWEREPEPSREPTTFEPPARSVPPPKPEATPDRDEIPESRPLVGVEPERMPAVPMSDSAPPPELPALEGETGNQSDDAVTLKPPGAPRPVEPEVRPDAESEVVDELLLPEPPTAVALPIPVASIVTTSPGIAPPTEPATPPIAADRIAAVRGLEDLTPEIHAELGARARTMKLSQDQEVGGYGLLWVMNGMVMVMPTVADAVIAIAHEGQTVFSRGNLDATVALRAVGGPEGAEVAVWQNEHLEEALAKCPWVADELRAIADRFQALAGASMGLLGERLDDSMRTMVTERAEVKLLLPGEVIFERGKPVVGLHVVGAGSVELVNEGAAERNLGPGELLFSSAVLAHEPAPALARAGAHGALVLYWDRMTTHELVVSVPPLLELVAMG